MDPPRPKLKLFSPSECCRRDHRTLLTNDGATEGHVRTGPLVFKNPLSEIIRDMPGFHTDQERRAHVQLVLQQRDKMVQVAGYDRMTAQISLLDQLILRGQSEDERARQILRRKCKEAQDRVSYAKWRLTHPTPPPKICIVHRHGRRAVHPVPLEPDDLYLNDTRPDNIWWPPLEHTCGLCLNTKSHPVK
jgi:hypothetical protein